MYKNEKKKGGNIIGKRQTDFEDIHAELARRDIENAVRERGREREGEREREGGGNQFSL